MNRARVVIISPALADANNGNWQTARRWQRMLAARHAVRIAREWPDAQAAGDQVMLALHARRSAPAIAAWAAQRGGERLAVVLTGTDLYRDILTDAAAQRSLALARTLVLLHELGPRALPEALRAKARVIRQSTTARAPQVKTGRHLRALMVGHLRSEKDPLTLLAAARLLRDEPRIRIDHVGAALDAALGRAARATGRDCPAYRWLGAQPHEATRRRIQRAHVLVHASRIEGGAHVVMEAVCSGTPVLASRIDGNVGMLGADYAGYFAPGDALALAALLREAWHTRDAPQGLLPRLAAQCARRAPLFAPDAERQALFELVASLGTD
ncbi:MAG: TIGR04348 family glycosyltransferase [Betaproteobacteria bacterium]|nr:TIGR04348 family glycosyltransferase [Betaproteobacteria bacterium]